MDVASSPPRVAYASAGPSRGKRMKPLGLSLRSFDNVGQNNLHCNSEQTLRAFDTLELERAGRERVVISGSSSVSPEAPSPSIQRIRAGQAGVL